MTPNKILFVSSDFDRASDFFGSIRPNTSALTSVTGSSIFVSFAG
jgi:hypothetical protein